MLSTTPQDKSRCTHCTLLHVRPRRWHVHELQRARRHADHESACRTPVAVPSSGSAATTQKRVQKLFHPLSAVTCKNCLLRRFHEVATGRKLALASRGFEVQNVFIDTLYDLALKEGVPQGEWGEFCRLQLPSPRLDDTDDVDAGAGGASVSYEVVGDGGAVKKVRKAMAKVTKLMGWRAKMASVARTYRQASSLIEKPEGMPAPDVGISDPTEAYGGGSLHGDVRSHATNAADAHLEMLRYDNGAPLTPSRDGETRAQRYNRTLRERMEARDQGRPSPK
jgi:hypothetical protein